MDYLYEALKRETGLAQREPEAESPAVPVAPGTRENAPAGANTLPIQSAQNHTKETSTLADRGEREEFYPDVVTSSAAARQHPERFYAFPAERMTKDRILGLEQIRVLRSRILELMRVRGMHTLLMTSSVAEEGKTITAINLALALSQVQGSRILLVDADLRKPAIARVLGMGSEGSLSAYLKSEVSLEQAVRHLNARLSFIPAQKTHSSVELLHSAQMKEFIRTVRESYDLVIVDAPPLYSIADAQILANYVDAVLLCVRAGHTSMEIVAECAGMVSGKLIGAVLVGGERQPHGYYSYSYLQDSRAEGKK